MIKATELKQWLATIPADSFVAIDEGGLALVEVDEDGLDRDAYLEVGGISEAGE